MSDAAPAAAAPRHAVPLAIDLQALAGIDPAATVARLDGATMGTGWRVLVATPAGAPLAPLQARIQQRLDGLVAEMSHWCASSALSRFNHAPAGSATVLPPDFAHVIAAAFDVAARSGGAFDPALGRLTDGWGLGPRPVARPPAADAIAIARTASGWQRLAFDPAARRLHQPGGVWLDLSGIAKGHAADAVAATVAAAGYDHALVEVGGECVGRGIRPDGDPWWVELEAPPGVELERFRVALHQLAVATSGDYVRGAHTLDPRTGRPIRHDTAAVSVLHASAMVADAWASALTVIEPDAALAMATRERLAARIVARSGREWLSPALEAML